MKTLAALVLFSVGGLLAVDLQPGSARGRESVAPVRPARVVAAVAPRVSTVSVAFVRNGWVVPVERIVRPGVRPELAALRELLDRHEPGYERDPTKKIQLLNHLAGLKDKRVPALAAPYLADMDEGVRYAAVEALVRQGDEAAGAGPLLDQLTKAEEDSLRIRLQIAEGFAELGWTVPADRREAVLKFLPEAFKLAPAKGDGKVEKKPPPKE